MHIVHVMTRMLRAGSEENILLTAKGQVAEGDTVTLVYGGHSSPDLAEKLVPEAKRVEVTPLVRPISPVNDFSAYRKMTDVFRDIRPDVVHTHQSKAGIVGRYAAAAANVPCIVHGVHILPFIGVGAAKRAIYLQAERRAARVTHGFIHVSRGMMDGCLDNDVGVDLPHEVVRSGFDLERFSKAEAPDDWRDILGVGEGAEKPLVLTMLAALEPRKRHMPMMDQLVPMLTQHPEARVLFAGEGDLRDEIEAKARSLGIEKNIRILGYRSDPERIIAMSDICLLASGQEGLPRSVLQYLTAGKPVVLFHLHGIEEIMKDGRNGRIIGSEDWAGYGAALCDLANDPGLRDLLAAGAAQTDLSDWDWRKMGRRTTGFYEQLNRLPAAKV